MKLNMLKRFQVSIVAYVCLDLLLHLWGTIMFQEFSWLRELLSQITLLLLFVSVAYSIAVLFELILSRFIFRMRPFHPSFHQVRRIRAPDAEGIEATLWRPFRPFPFIPQSYVDWIMPHNATLITIENPPTTDKTSKMRFEHIAIAYPYKQ